MVWPGGSAEVLVYFAMPLLLLAALYISVLVTCTVVLLPEIVRVNIQNTSTGQHIFNRL